MKIKISTRILALVILGSFIVVPIACSSDDGGGGDTPKTESPIPDPTNASTTIVATSPVVADGTTTATITITIADTKGKQLTTSGGTVALASSGAAIVSSVTDNGNGTYTATVTNTTAETVTISGTLAGTAITDTAEITFDTPPEVDATNENTTIEATLTTLVEGTSTSIVTVQLADTNGNSYPSSGGTITLAATGAASISAIIDNGDGTYTATVTSTAEEVIIVSGSLDAVDITDTAQIIFNPDDSNPAQEAPQSTVAIGPSLIRINSGGPEVTFGGITFLEDQYFSANTTAYTNPNVTEIADTDMDALFLTERITVNVLSALSYEIPVTNGSYTVKLYFAEIYWGVENPEGFEGDVGKRIFNATIEDTQVFVGYDLQKDIGSATADTRMYDVEVTDGIMTITLEATVNKAKISAIEILGNGTIGN